jgi:hypothetical protein
VRVNLQTGGSESLRGWAGDAALFRKILVDNPARLYDF